MTGSRQDYTEATIARDQARSDAQDLADYFDGEVIEVQIEDYVRNIESGEVFDVVRVGGGRHWNTGEVRIRSAIGVVRWDRLVEGAWEKLDVHESALIQNEYFDANEAYWLEMSDRYTKDWD